MKKQTLKRLTFLPLLLICSASLSNRTFAQQSAVVPAPASLEIQISASVSERGDKFVILDPIQPHFSVVLRNASDKPLQIYAEGNSSGYDNLHLEITAVDGKALATPLVVERGPRAWRANMASTETLAHNAAIVRETYLHVPAEIRHPETPATLEEGTEDLNPFGEDYWFFPFPKKSTRNTVTMKAVFEIKSGSRPTPGIWAGRIESAPLTYDIGWGAPRR